MEKLLKQEQIDALFEAARNSAHDATKAPASKRFTPFDFSAAGDLSTSQLRAMSSLNELFARNLTHSLTAWLRARFQVNPVLTEQIGFNELLLRVPEIAYLASLRLEPLGALCLLQLDLVLAPPVIDLLLGGAGLPGPLRELTEIEESILAGVVRMICAELTSAWEAVGLRFTFERRQLQAQAARLLPAGEKTLCISFEVRTQACAGLMSLVLPAIASNAALRRLTCERGSRGQVGEARARMEVLARRIRFGATLQLPPVRLPAGALESLQPGGVVSLHLPATSLAEWCVAGRRLGTAWAIRQGDRRAARLENMEAESIP